MRTALTEFEKQRVALVGDDLAVGFAQLGAVFARHGLYEPMRAALVLGLPQLKVLVRPTLFGSLKTS